MNRTDSAGKNQNLQSLWIRNFLFDFTFFHLSGILSLLLVIPYLMYGNSVIFPIYGFYLAFFGLPHNYLTWATLLPKSSRENFVMEPVYTAVIFCTILVLIISLTEGTELNDWILSFISYYSLWHSYRQHHGICKFYDLIQAKRTGDFSVFNDRKAMNLFFGLALNGVLVWAFTRGKIKYLLSEDEFYNLIHPVVPMNIYRFYVIGTALVGLWAMKRGIYDRWRKRVFIPWPQIALMMTAIATYIVPYFFITLREMPLAVAIGTIYHNVQYFGFVWLFERQRSVEMVEKNHALQLPQRLCFRNSWVRYFSIAFTYSFVIILIYKLAPHRAGMALIYFVGIVHYIVDGYIWRRENNKFLPVVVDRLAAALPISALKKA